MRCLGVSSDGVLQAAINLRARVGNQKLVVQQHSPFTKDADGRTVQLLHLYGMPVVGSESVPEDEVHIVDDSGRWFWRVMNPARR